MQLNFTTKKKIDKTYVIAQTLKTTYTHLIFCKITFSKLHELAMNPIIISVPEIGNNYSDNHAFLRSALNYILPDLKYLYILPDINI